MHLTAALELRKKNELFLRGHRYAASGACSVRSYGGTAPLFSVITRLPSGERSVVHGHCAAELSLLSSLQCCGDRIQVQ